MSILVVVEGKRDLGWEPLQSLPGCLLPVPLPVEPVLVLGQPGQKAFPGRGCRQKKKSLAPHSLKMFQSLCLRFVFGLNLSPGPMSQLGGSKPCRASETGAVRPSAKPAVLW